MTLTQIFMMPFSWLYGLGISGRNLIYDAGIMPVFRPSVPVISVGNITAGGTGKTPFVEYLLRHYLSKGYKPCVLSRGYKRTTRGMRVVSDGIKVTGNAFTAGDEPFQIARKFPGAVVIVSEKRKSGADFAMKQYRPALFILDDGFQHRAMGRDLDIVIIDGSRNLAEIPLIPAGLRREHISSLRRADVLVRSHSDKNKGVAPGVPEIEMQYNVKSFHSVGGDDNYSPEYMRGKRCVVFSGIGNPENLVSTLKSNGIEILKYHRFPDHYVYNQDDLSAIRASLETAKGDFAVTTEKDAVRLDALGLPPSFPLHLILSVVIEAAIPRGEETLSRMLDEKIDRKIS